MWKKVTIEDKTFIMRIYSDNNKHEIMLSDFSKFWMESLSEQELLNRCKELNQLYEAEPEILIKRIKELIEPDKPNIKKEFLEVGNQLTISFSCYLNGFLFKFQFILICATPEKFCQSLTFPLIQIIEELQERQKKLCNLIVKKDAEISEYKMEGATITRKNVITEPFNEQKFLESCSSNHAEKRSLENLRCPFSFFEESCSELYEECSKRKMVAEEALSPKKTQQQEGKVDAEKKEKPASSRRKKTNELIYADNEDENEVDEDETYFSVPKPGFKTAAKPAVQKSGTSKKRKTLNL